MSSQSTIPAVQLAHPLHIQLPDEECPSCGQVIPPEKLEEIKGKIASKERDRALAITTNLEIRFQQERQEQLADWQRSLDAAAEARKIAEEGNATLKAQLIQAQRDSVAAAEAAKIEGKREAEQLAASQLAQAQNARSESEAALQVRIQQAEAATEEAKAATKQAVNAAVAEKLAEARNARSESEAALEARIKQAEAATEEAKAATKQAVDAAVAEKLAEAQNARSESEAGFRSRITHAEAAAAAAEELVRNKQAAADEAIATANAKASEAESQLTALKDHQAAALARSLEEQRGVLEKDKADALNAQAAKSFAEHQKLTTTVGELTRALEKKSNEELGEGAEVDLYEALKSEFPEDRITRVKKGESGGDILHVVVAKGHDCGTIIYDSKNHKAYRSEHVAKLKVDQLAANAEHAILSTHKFPQGKGQLHMIDGVVLANPARVVLLAKLVRRHLIQVHGLRLSSIERDSKTEALCSFTTSEQCSLLFQRVGSKAGELIELQEKEIKWHKLNWTKQGETLRVIQKTNAELENEISIIVGTAAKEDEVDEALEA
jgi:hypothetical protein